MELQQQQKAFENAPAMIASCAGTFFSLGLVFARVKPAHIYGNGLISVNSVSNL
jgi:hypothetical protein